MHHEVSFADEALSQSCDEAARVALMGAMGAACPRQVRSRSMS